MNGMFVLIKTHMPNVLILITEMITRNTLVKVDFTLLLLMSRVYKLCFAENLR